MHSLNSRGATHSHSLNHHGAEDIKKGLERIKQAQIQVLRELRKDDPELSRNHSLTYSKQTTLDSKPNLKFDGETVLLKQKIEKLQQELSDSIAKEAKLKKQCILLAEEAKKCKEISTKAELKMKEYEKSEERALAKAQEGLANAITSEKKYIGLKTEYDRINKQRQRLTYELKRIQKKQISEVINTHEGESHIPNKLIKELTSAQQHFLDLVREINNHKCVKKQAASSSKNSQPPVSVNGFTISTFETQQKLDKNINNIIMYLNTLQNLAPITHLYESNNYMSGSFREDMRKIEEELDQASKGKNEKIGELQGTIQQLNRKNSKLEADLRECQDENTAIKSRLKALAKELEDVRLAKTVLEEEYEKFKTHSEQKLRLKIEQLEEYKNKYNLSWSGSANIDKSKKSSVNSNNPESSEPLQQKIAKLEKQSEAIQQKLSSSLLREQSLKQVISRLEAQLESMKMQSQANELEQKHEMNRLAIRMQTEGSQNRRHNEEWDQMVRSISKMQEERMEMISRQKEMSGRLESEEKKYRNQVQNLEQELEQLKQQIQQMRRESIALSFDQAELLRLRNKEQLKDEQILNQTAQPTWNPKEDQSSLSPLQASNNQQQRRQQEQKEQQVLMSPQQQQQQRILPQSHVEPQQIIIPQQQLLIQQQQPVPLTFTPQVQIQRRQEEQRNYQPANHQIGYRHQIFEMQPMEQNLPYPVQPGNYVYPNHQPSLYYPVYPAQLVGPVYRSGYPSGQFLH